jgi:hypothetical protein
MRTSILFSFAILFVVSGLQSCKYPDGPLISLKSKEARIAGTWDFEKVTENGQDRTSDYSSFKWTFTEDNGATAAAEISPSVFVELNGTWALLQNGEIFQTTLSGSFLMVPISQVTEYTILRLTKDEFWVRNEEDNTEFQLKKR